MIPEVKNTQADFYSVFINSWNYTEDLATRLQNLAIEVIQYIGNLFHEAYSYCFPHDLSPKQNHESHCSKDCLQHLLNQPLCTDSKNTITLIKPQDDSGYLSEKGSPNNTPADSSYNRSFQEGSKEHDPNPTPVDSNKQIRGNSLCSFSSQETIELLTEKEEKEKEDLDPISSEKIQNIEPNTNSLFFSIAPQQEKPTTVLSSPNNQKQDISKEEQIVSAYLTNKKSAFRSPSFSKPLISMDWELALEILLTKHDIKELNALNWKSWIPKVSTNLQNISSEREEELITKYTNLLPKKIPSGESLVRDFIKNHKNVKTFFNSIHSL